MRNFLSYLNRRGVVDSAARLKWASRNKLSTIADVEAFCVSRELKITHENMQKAFSFLINEPAVPPAALRQDSSEKESKSWHVPAAERPLGKAHVAHSAKPNRKKRARKVTAAKGEK